MDPAPDELIGRVFGGRFEIVKPLRRGGMGAVYEGRDVVKGGAVAVKVVRPSLLEEEGALARFKREMRLATEIEHENVVRSLQSGDDGGFLWIAMELLSGSSLRERIDTSGRMTWQESLSIVEQIVRALGAAHARKVSHRDLKPENVMLSGGIAKLVDFGIAKQARVDGEGESTHMTGTGFIIGTPGYVAPELILEGVTDDPRSDFYALGVTWFEMLTGQQPFTAKTPLALTLRHAHETPPTPSTLLPFSPVPAPIEQLIARLLMKSPDARPASATELLALLQRLRVDAESRVPTSTPVDATMTDVGAVATGVMPFVRTPPPASLTPASPATSTTPAPTSTSTSPTPPPELLRQLPRSWIAGAAFFVVAAIAAASAVSVFAVRQTQPALSTTTTAEPTTVAATPTPTPILTPAVPATTTTTIQVTELPDPLPPTPVPTPVSTTKPKTTTPKEKPVEVTSAPGNLLVRPRPTTSSWKVSLDGDFALETPKLFKDVAPGAHQIRLTSSSLHIDVVRSVVVVSGRTVTFEENLAP